jgi:simple sugar transport system substrate-binding protein
MLKRFAILLLSALLLGPFTVNAKAADRTGTGMHIWFDTGGPVGGTYNTVVYNGAKAAAEDIDAKITFVYSDWSPEKMVANFKTALTEKYGFSGLNIDTGGGFIGADNLSLIAPLAKKGLR